MTHYDVETSETGKASKIESQFPFTYVNPDYKVRIDPDVLLAAAKAVLKK